MSSPVPSIVQTVERVLGDKPRPIPLHLPALEGNAWAYVKECIDTGWVSSAGAYVTQFEEMLAEYTGAKHAVAVVNGTSALHIACLMAGVEPGDEVLMPALTFVATANAVSYCQATPHFVEVSATTLGIDPHRLADYLQANTESRDGRCYNKKTGARIAAVVPMHTFGHPVQLEELLEVAGRFGIVMVEDAAESLGSYYRGQHTGTLGKLGILSFNGNKVITTGGGGAVLTNDQDLAAKAKHITTTGKLPHKWEYVHDVQAYNYRLPNLNAALGCSQLEVLPRLLESKRALAERYRQAFEGMAGATFLTEPDDCQSNYWLNAVILDQEHADQHVPLMEAFHEAGLLVRPIWKPMHHLPIYQACPRDDLAVTESLAQRVVNLPSSADL